MLPMAGGYAGKIIRVNLTNKSTSTLDTAQYEEYGGGHGIGSAIFWDLIGNQLPFSALDPLFRKYGSKVDAASRRVSYLL
jgi:aldehyde:ferredoxin oxidoreductase